MTPFYEDALVKIYHGDCLEIMLTLERADHVITDPPYTKVVVNSSRGAPRGTVGAQIRRDLGYSGVTDDDRIALGREIGRIARRWALVFCDAESLTAWRLALEAGGMRHIRMGSWTSPACTPQFTGDRPGTGWEACEIAHAEGRCRWNGGGKPAAWIVNRPLNGTREREEADHPTPKPIALIAQLVKDFTDVGETIIDPFGGSGTTGIAAKSLGRLCILIEKEERFCEVAARRLSQVMDFSSSVDNPENQTTLF